MELLYTDRMNQKRTKLQLEESCSLLLLTVLWRNGSGKSFQQRLKQHAVVPKFYPELISTGLD